MAEWTVAIADDEPAARRGVRQLLRAHARFVVTAECRNGAEVLELLERETPDVLFLDVQMPGLCGFDVLARRDGRRLPLTVFLTAYQQFAVQAFEAEAVDYLLKPVSERRFAATIGRLERLLQINQRGSDQHRGGERFRVSTVRGTVIIDPADIEWIEAAGNYARLWVGGTGYLHRESIAQLERRLQSSGFLRVHRSAMVRVDCVRAVENRGAGVRSLLLASGVRVPISRRRAPGLKAALRRD